MKGTLLRDLRKAILRGWHERFEYNPITDLWLAYQFQKLDDELPYMDNKRVARVGDSFQEYRYEILRERGCCGFVDLEKRFIFSRYKIGCNYGH